LALNGEPVEDNAGLRQRVFIAGPARVMDVMVERAGEKMHFPVLLTLNLNSELGGMSSPPPLNLETELPASDDPQARANARLQALTATANVYIQSTEAVQPVRVDENMNAKDFEPNSSREVNAKKRRSNRTRQNCIEVVQRPNLFKPLNIVAQSPESQLSVSRPHKVAEYKPRHFESRA
jgi:hypothetical protein